MANKGPNLNASNFFITLSDEERLHLKGKHTIFGKVSEGLEVIDKINSIYVDSNERPYQNLRIKHTLLIFDPFENEDPKGLIVPSRSPSPIREVKSNGIDGEYDLRLEDDVDINTLMKGKTDEEIQKEIIEHQTNTRKAVLEILEDLPDADIEPAENILFVCKLNAVT